MAVNVAVTGLGASDVTAPGIGVLRSLAAGRGSELGKLIGLAYETLEAGVYEPDVADEVYLLPYPSQGLDPFLGRLSDIHRKTRIDVLIPNLDAEITPLVKNMDRFSGLGIKFFVPDAKSFEARSKDRLSLFANRCGLESPRTVVVSDETSLMGAAGEVGWPLLVKGIYYDAYLVTSIGEALGVLRKLVARWGYPVMVQEYIAGQEFDICALGDGRGGLIGAVPITKLYLTEKGKAWAGVTVSEEELFLITRRVVEALSWRGPLEVEVIKSGADGRYYLLEINPRFPAWVYLCQAAGQNLPLALVDLALGKPTPAFTDYEVGTRFIRSARDLIVSKQEYEAIHTRGEIVGRGEV